MVENKDIEKLLTVALAEYERNEEWEECIKTVNSIIRYHKLYFKFLFVVTALALAGRILVAMM